MRGPAECIVLVTSDCQQLTDTVVYHLSQESEVALPFVRFDSGSNLWSLLPVGCGVQWPLQSEKPFVASSFQKRTVGAYAVSDLIGHAQSLYRGSSKLDRGRSSCTWRGGGV